MSQREDAAWARSHGPEIQRMLVQHVGEDPRPVQQPDIADDAQVWRAYCRDRDRDVDVLVRVRRVGYPLHEYTLRSGRPRSKAPTELHRVMDGWGDYYVYAHASGYDTIAAWTVISLDQFRVHRPKGRTKQTGDGSAWFAIFELPGPDGLVHAHGNPWLSRYADRAAKQAERDAADQQQRAEAEHGRQAFDVMAELCDEEDQPPPQPLE